MVEYVKIEFIVINLENKQEYLFEIMINLGEMKRMWGFNIILKFLLCFCIRNFNLQ